MELKYQWKLSRLAELSNIGLYALDNNYLQLSASMLYQVLSMLYSLAEELYIGTEKPGYTLIERTEYLEKFSPELFAIFNPKNNHHIHLARKLRDAYRNFHSVEVVFSFKEIDRLFLKVDGMLQKTQVLYNDIISQVALQIRNIKNIGQG